NATRSGPQLPTSYAPVGQLVNVKRSAIETAAPLWTVPLNEDGPGMVPSTPTTISPDPDGFVARRPFTRKRFMRLPGFADDSVNIWFISSQGPVEVTFRLSPKRA